MNRCEPGERGPAPAWRQWVERWWPLVAGVLGRLSVGIVASAVAMFLFLKLADEMREGGTRSIDAGALQTLATYRDPVLFHLMEGLSWLAGPVPQGAVIALAVLGCALFRRFWPDGATMLLAGVGGVGLMVALKALFQRPRPEEVFAGLGYSFPSGHSFFALVVYGMLAYWAAREAPLRRKLVVWAIAVGATLLVGFSRMYVGEHYPSDVAAGYALAVPWLWSCLALPKALGQRRPAGKR